MTITTNTWFFRSFLLVALGLALLNPANAGPANPEVLKIQQPDGTVFQSRMRGDEFQGWMETVDGYTIVKNPDSSFYEYAAQAPDGALRPSGIVVGTAAGAQIAGRALLPPKGLRPPRNADLEQYQGDFLNAVRAEKPAADNPVNFAGAPALTGTWAPVPVLGAKKILLILVEFTDAKLSANAATYWNNAVHNATGASVAKYYQDNSFGKISIAPVAHTQAGSPAGVVSVALAQNHPNCTGGHCSYATESAWINSALAAAAPSVNFPALDTNADGTISVDETLIYFIVAGYETSAGSGLTPSYWAHAWGGGGVSVSGKLVNHWAMNGEKLNAATQMQMGVIAHEMGHAMGGLPDLYDTSGSNEGLGIFSLMAGGSWGRRQGETGGATPVGFDAWSRQYLGWSTPQFPANGATISLDSPLSSAAASFMLLNSANTSEYWLVENRPPVGWDAGMYSYMGGWTGGLLIQHIDLNVGAKSGNSFNKYVIGAHQGNMAVEPATAGCSLKVVTSPSTASRGCQSILFYSGNSVALNGASSPNSNYFNGNATGLGVSAISAPGSTMTAVVQNLSAPPGCNYALGSSAAAFNASVNFGNVSLTTTAACSWVALSNVSWIGVTSNTTGTGSANVSFALAANTGNTRSGTIVIGWKVFTITQAAGPNAFPLNGVLPAGWITSAGANGGWSVVSDQTMEGGYSLRSNQITNSQKAQIEVTQLLPTSNVSFALKTSSESKFDFLRFYVDGVKRQEWSGELAWTTVSYPISAGSHTLRWSYEKDTSSASGSDAAWIDDVRFTVATSPGAPVMNTLTIGAGSATAGITAGNDGGTAITGYTVTCIAAGKPSRSSTGTNSPITVRGLIGGIAYSCSVSASNIVGAGTASAALQVTPLPANNLVPVMMLLFEG